MESLAISAIQSSLEKDLKGEKREYVVEYSIPRDSITADNLIMEIQIYRKGISIPALIGQLLLILAAPVGFIIVFTINAMLGFLISLAFLAVGGEIRRLNRNLFQRGRPLKILNIAKISR